jgi:hypothetical protein
LFPAVSGCFRLFCFVLSKEKTITYLSFPAVSGCLPTLKGIFDFSFWRTFLLRAREAIYKEPETAGKMAQMPEYKRKTASLKSRKQPETTGKSRKFS